MKIFALSALGLAALGACASVADRSQRDLASVTGDLFERTGFELNESDATTAHALLEQPIGPDQAVLAALALDPRAREALAELDVASARRVRAGLIRNPALQLGLARLDGETDLDLDLTQPLAELLTLGARTDRAEGELLAERARATRTLVRLVHDVRRDWIEAALAGRVAGLARERVEAEEAATRLADELHRAGNVVDSVLTLSQLALADARSRLELAESNAAVARERLARHFGDAALQVALAPDAGFPSQPPVGLETKAEAASLDLQEARARVEAAARAAGVARWETLLERSSLGLTVRDEDGRNGAGPTFALAIPLFDDGSAAGAEARARLEVALARHSMLELELRESVRSAERRLGASIERLRIARSELAPAASRHLDEVLRQYNAMQVGVFEVLEARREELDALEASLELEREQRLAALDVDELLAGSLPAETQSESLATATRN